MDAKQQGRKNEQRGAAIAPLLIKEGEAAGDVRSRKRGRGRDERRSRGHGRRRAREKGETKRERERPLLARSFLVALLFVFSSRLGRIAATWASQAQACSATRTHAHMRTAIRKHAVFSGLSVLAVAPLFL